MLLGMAANVNDMAAVAVMLSLGHNPSQVAVGTGVSVNIGVGLAVGSGSTVGVRVVAGRTGPQATSRKTIRLAERNRKIAGIVVFIAHTSEKNSVASVIPLAALPC